MTLSSLRDDGSLPLKPSTITHTYHIAACYLIHPPCNNLDFDMSASSHDCQSPLQYYTCNSNGFKGCCSVDPCNPSGCPRQDGESEPATDAQTAAAASSSKGARRSSPKPVSISPSPAVHSDAPSSTKPVLANSGPMTSSTSSNNPFEAATLLVPRPPVTTASTEGSSLVLITSVVFVSQEMVTPTSNGIALAPTSSVVTSTALSSMVTSVAALSAHPSSASSALVTTSRTTTPSSPSPGSHSATPVIAGSVGGAAGVVAAALSIWLLVRWQRSRRTKETRKAQLDDDPRLQGIDAHRAGSAFKIDAGKSTLNPSVCTSISEKASAG